MRELIRENIRLLLEQSQVLKNNNLFKLFVSVSAATKGRRIDLNSIKVNVVDNGTSTFEFTTSESGTLVKSILLTYSEESDNGTCPSCESVRRRFPKHKIIKVGPNKNLEMGTFGKNRKYQVIALLPTTKTKKTNKKQPTDFKSISPKGLQVLKQEEKFVPYKYDDGYGNPTIGYGTLVKNYPELKKVKQISQPVALKYVAKHIKNNCVPEIHDAVRVPLTQNQFDALCMFIYNVGETNFRDSSVLKYLNSGKLSDMKNVWKKYVYSNGKKSNGLEKRRNTELNLFFGRL